MPDYGYAASPPEHPRDVGDVLNRVDEILQADASIGGQAVRHRIRSVMNGGKEAVAALLGDLAPDLAHLPAANFIYSHLTRLAQKLGHLPDVRVPSIKDASDAQRRRAENRQHLIQAWDSYDELESQMPVLARWLPGYGYACVVVSEKLTPWGDTYPCATIRDSYGVIPGDWGLGSTPIDVSILRRTSAKRLMESFPNSTRSLRMAIDNARRAPGGGILLGRQSSGILQSRYEDPYLQAVDWVEYIDIHGRWLVLPEHKELLEFIPNPCESQPQFAMFRAPSFDRPAGHHEHAYGLQAMIAKQQLLEEIHMVEAVNSTELNIDGEILSNGGVYQRGRGKINVTTPGTNVSRMNWSLPYQIFEHTARLVDQLRTTINYPIGDDGKSQLSYATGAGLEELSTPSGREIEEYHKASARAFRQLDSIRLEIDEKTSTDRKRFYVVVNNAAYDQTYDPKAVIGGQFKTERGYGFLAALDEPERISIGNIMLASGVIDEHGARSMVKGIGDPDEIRSRIDQTRLREFFIAALQGQIPMPPPVIVRTMMGVLDKRDWVSKALAEVIPSEEEEAELAAQQSQQMAAQPPPGLASGQPPPDIVSLMSSLGAEGADSSVRTSRTVRT